jgi:[acyl-carrier-protein] S-malonyltransferase
VVAPANYNAPEQTVIAGDALAVEIACRRAREAGARRTLALPVSAPFHCPLMAHAAEKLAPELGSVSFADPTPPVVTNVEAAPNREGRRVAQLLRSQVTAPVRFTEMVQRLAALGVTHVLEVGPGRVLSGLVARSAPGLRRASCGTLAEIPAAAEFAAGALAVG